METVASTLLCMDSGAILTSIIAASVATVGLGVGKDSKVSEFRQEWIDRLREDVAKCCSVSVALYHGNVRFSMRERLNLDIKYGATDDLVVEANNLRYRIRLRLDSSKRRSTELNDALDLLTGLASTASQPFDVVMEAVQNVLGKTEIVLDEAWIRVRRGEVRFRVTYSFAILTLLSSIGLLVFHWYHTGHKL